MESSNEVNVVIVGAGVVGLAVAERLSKKYEVLVLEKEKSFGQHTSSRNSEVVHSGIYYPKDSLKSKLCSSGNEQLYKFCLKHNVPHKMCGKLIVSHSKEDSEKLHKLYDNGLLNDVPLIWIDKSELTEMEPSLKECHSAIFSPTTGIIDSHALMKKLEYLALQSGAMIAYGNAVITISVITDGFSVEVERGFKVTTDILINCAGLWSDKVSKMVSANDYEIKYCKGEYFKTNSIKNMNHLVYTIPQEHSLGIHTRMNLSGEISFGPNAYFVNEIEYSVREENKIDFLKEMSRLLNKEFTEIDLSPDYAGIRPKINNKTDFIIEKDKTHPNVINLIGIESPGLTCCLSIAEYVEDLLSG